MRRLAVLSTTILVMLACDEETACDRYADYVCACHDGEPGFDCDELRDLAEEPTQSVVDQCAIDLADQEAEDEANGVTCEV